MIGKEQAIQGFRALGIPQLAGLEDLNLMPGSAVNLELPLPGGRRVKLLDDGGQYWANQVCRQDGRCYGLATDGEWLLVCEYGDYGSDPALVVFRRFDL